MENLWDEVVYRQEQFDEVEVHFVQEASMLRLPPQVYPRKITFIYNNEPIVLERVREITNNPDNYEGIETENMGWVYQASTNNLITIELSIIND